MTGTEDTRDVPRTLGLFGATGVGVGAIVGGGILALAGVAFVTAGPGALLAFALNGVIALLTALSFAEISAAFPESGGTYSFAKRFLNVRAAFSVGWIVWFASLVAAALYALGFGTFAVLVLEEGAPLVLDAPPAWIEASWLPLLFALAATLVYAVGLLRRGGGGGAWINVAKVVVFAAVIAGGVWALTRTPAARVADNLSPFLSHGTTGLFRAMGFTFIALQGFDLIAAVAGEVKEPGRNVPRAMIYSLLIAIAIYLPLLFLVSAVSVQPGESIEGLSRQDPEGVIPLAARRFLGDAGYWLVVVAGVLAMLSALHANLFAASRVAHAMARDRTLSPILGRLDPQKGIPRLAVLAVTGLVVTLLFLVRDVATAGAAASLIFLVTFFVAHGINVLFHRRIEPERMPFRVRLFPLVPLVGGLACLALAVYQGVSVPRAGVIGLVWLVLGSVLFLVRFAGRAAAYDASAEAADPALARSRGRMPLVLVPLANAANAPSMIAVAHAVAPQGYGRVLILNVVRPPGRTPEESEQALGAAERVLRSALATALAEGVTPEAVFAVSPHPVDAIRRIARERRCESVLLGLRDLSDQSDAAAFDRLVDGVESDVLVLRAQPDWRLAASRRVLVAVGGRGRHSPLRARLLGSLRRLGQPEIRYLCVLPERSSEEGTARMRRRLQVSADDEAGGFAEVEVQRHADPAAAIVAQAAEADLLVLGLYQEAGRHLRISPLILRVARETSCAVLVLGHKARR